MFCAMITPLNIVIVLWACAICADNQSDVIRHLGEQNVAVVDGDNNTTSVDNATNATSPSTTSFTSSEEATMMTSGAADLDNSTLLEDNSTWVEDNSTLAEGNSTLDGDNSTVITTTTMVSRDTTATASLDTTANGYGAAITKQPMNRKGKAANRKILLGLIIPMLILSMVLGFVVYRKIKQRQTRNWREVPGGEYALPATFENPAYVYDSNL